MEYLDSGITLAFLRSDNILAQFCKKSSIVLLILILNLAAQNH
jgi:hypothetical protein